MLATPGQLLVNAALPPELRDYTRTLGQDEINAVLGQLAREQPEKYREVSWKLVQLGRNAAFDEGSTITLNDLVPVVDKRPMLDLVRKQEAAIRADRRLTDEQKDEAIETLYGEATKRLTDETYKNALGRNNPFALQAKYKARGNPSQLGAMLTSPGTYTDSTGKIVPVFINRSYAEGLLPHEYWAAGYGARLGICCLTPDTKVLMADWSEREIGSLRPGDIVMGARKDGTIYPVRVKHFFDNGIQPVYRWTFRAMSSQSFVDIKATVSHKLLARTRRWGSGGAADPLSDSCVVPLGSAKFGKTPDHNAYFAQVSSGGHFTGRRVDTALLIGLMTGDGCCSNKAWTDMSFSCADPLLIEDTREYLSGLNLKLHLASKPYTHTFSRIEKRAHEWYYTSDGHKFNNRARYDVWRYIGGCHSWDKKIPYDINEWDDQSIIEYLAGLFATDGSFYKGRRGNVAFSIALNSLSIIEGVKRILELRFGVWCSPVHDMQREREHHMYGISVSHPDAYNKLVSIIKDAIPGIKKRKIKNPTAIKNSRRTPDIGFRIQTKEYLGEQHVVDIEVDSPDHLFVLANGIISSNSTKLGTQKGGYLSKMMNAAAIDQVVTEDDCGTSNGMPVSVDDNDSVGAVLQGDVAGFKSGTVLTKTVLDKIRDSGADEIVVRSPITCGCKNGLCKRCVGIRETGRFPDIGYNVGVNAASALGEQVAQSALNTKHCAAKGTLVRMADWTTKAIEDIVVGDQVIGSDRNGRLSPVRVIATFYNGIQPCVRTRFRKNGSSHKDAVYAEFESTKDHKVLAASERFGRHEPLPVGLVCPRYQAFTATSFSDSGHTKEPLAALVGVMTGDCCLMPSAKTLRITCSDESLADDLRSGLAGTGVSMVSAKEGQRQLIRVSGGGIREFLVREGLYGHRVNDRTVPASFHTWDNESVAAFVGGVVAANGSVYSCRRYHAVNVSLPSTSLRLLREVQSVLRDRFGVLATAVTTTRKKGCRSGLCVSNFDQLRIDVSAREAVERFDAHVTIPGKKGRLLRRLLAEMPQPHMHRDQCLERAEQVEIGDRPVYDIMVDNADHLFLLANGLIVSNSGKRSDLGAYVGFDALKNLSTIPKSFDVKASVTPRDGRVTSIDDAPQGGQYVTLDDEASDRIYIPGSLSATVKVGDRLEAGDAVSDGIISPEDVVAYKGVGEGRRYFTDSFARVFRNSKYGVNRRNVEVLSRALVNNVQVEHPDAEGDALPGDIVRYSAWAGGYVPREGAAQTPVDKSVGQYLEAPYLHYTIGTRVTPRVVQALKKHGTTDILVNKTAPGVVPHMVSVVESPAYSGDWMARLGTSYLKDRLLEDAQTGARSTLHGTNPIPGIAKGIELGKDISTTGEY